MQSWIRWWVILVAVGLTLGCTRYTRERGLSFDQLDYPGETQTVDVDGLKIAYLDLGSGPRTIILIHGLGSNLTFWKENLDALSRNYRVLALDLPGFGRSSKANYGYSMAFFARAVDGFMDQLGIEDGVLMGHSLGGQVAMTHALRYPGKATELILIAPAGLEPFEPSEAAWLAEVVTAKAVMHKDAEAVYTSVAGNFYHMPREADFLVNDRLKIIEGPDFAQYCYANSRAVAAMVEGPVWDRLGEIAVPVLVVFGEADQLIPNPVIHGGSTRRLATRSVARFPDARLVMVPRAGHMVQFERAARVNEEVLEFLQGTGLGQRKR